MDDDDFVPVPQPTEKPVLCPICGGGHLMDVSIILSAKSPEVQKQLKEIGTKMTRTDKSPAKVRDYICMNCGLEMPHIHILNPTWYLSYT
jgi:acetone carboxylase gamma subunit